MRASHIIASVFAVGLVVLTTLYVREDARPLKTESINPPRALPTVPAQAQLAQSEEAEPSSPENISGPSIDTRRSPIVGPRGRILEAETDRPVEGLVVTMTFGKKILAEAVTGSDGWFSLPQPDRSRRTVEVVSEDWRFTPSKIRLNEEQSSGARELLFHADRIVAAPLRGLLQDRRTGEPVPEFLVQARGPRRVVRESKTEVDPDPVQPSGTFEFHSPPRRIENIVTNAEGRFASEGGFEAGLLDLVLVDHSSFLERGAHFPDEATAVEHQHTFDGVSPPEDVEIKVAIGPTYRLDVALPSETSVDDFYATFPQPPTGLREMHRAVSEDPDSPMALFYGGAMRPNGLEQVAPLREGESVWARFREPVFDMSGVSGEENDHVLHVRSRDGHWSGSARVTSIEGIYPTVVPISLEARGSVEGTVLDGEGKPVPQAWIQLIAATAPASPIHEVGADPKGRFAFKWLADGVYEVIVQTDRYEESKSLISIVKGTTERLEIRLASSVPLGTVSGVLRGRTGQHRSKGGIVSLESLDDPDFYLRKTASYRKRNGEYTAAFSFENVPSGNYELSLKPLDNMRWEALTMRVFAPAEGLEFICEDDTPTFDLELRAIDAQTGTPIEKRWEIVWQGDPLNDVRLDDDWQTGLYKGVPEGVPLQWVLRAEGYRLARGDETSIRTEADHRVIEARLERGWGQIFKVTTRDVEPIEGVELFADGTSIGVTDAQGMVAMNLDGKPGGLEFRYKDWVVTWGRVDPNEDGFGWGPETPVYLGSGD